MGVSAGSLQVLYVTVEGASPRFALLAEMYK